MARKLNQRSVAAASRPERLTARLDPQMQTEAAPPRTRLNLVIAGEEVSRLSVIDFQQQIGSQTVRMGGIAGLYTPEEHRLKGHARRLMINALRWMRHEGFDTTMLYGIRNFYPRFGYVPAFPSVTFTVAVRDVEAVSSRGFRVIDYRPGHLPDVLRLYHKTNAGRAGPTRRDPKLWPPWRKGVGYRSKAVCKVFRDGRRKLAGYLVYSDDFLDPTVIEIGYDSAALFPALLRTAAGIAWDQRLENIRLSLPEDEPFIEFCKPLGVKKELRCRRDGGAMVRMINIASAVRNVAPVLARRMGGRGRLNLYTNLDDVGVRWSRGEVTVGRPVRGAPQARMPQWALAQMLYGYRSASALETRGELSASRQAAAALEEMFPPAPHFHYAVDGF